MFLEPRPNRRGVERTVEPEGPRERSSPIGELEAGGRGMQVRAPTRSDAALIGYDGPKRPDEVDDHTQQIGLRRLPPTSHTRTHGGRATHQPYILPAWRSTGRRLHNARSSPYGRSPYLLSEPGDRATVVLTRGNRSFEHHLQARASDAGQTSSPTRRSRHGRPVHPGGVGVGNQPRPGRLRRRHPDGDN